MSRRARPKARVLTVEESATTPTRPWLRCLCILVICAATAAAYSSSFKGAFLLDDYILILEDRFENPWPPWPLLNGPRPVVDVSLAINYAISEIDPTSYHVVNFAIHLAAALTLFGLVRRTLAKSGDSHRNVDTPTIVAFAAALLWAVHPLNTQAVTYVIQRSESLMALFYLLTLYCLLRGAESKRRVAWFVCAVLACALGMATKAVMVTAPIVALLYDRAFLSRSWPEVLKRRWPVHLALAATWSILVATGVLGGVLTTSPEAGSTVGFGVATIKPVHYALTQFGVILHYLRLALWPHPLCLDYFDWPAARRVADVALPLVCVPLLLFATAAAWFHRPALGFLGAAFFLILAPTSSIVPIQDLAFEHRMYLPLAAVILLIVAPLCSRRIPVAPALMLVGLLAFALGYASYERNKTYASAINMWRDVVAKRPANARAHNNLAVALLDEADPDEALEHFGRAIRHAPNEVKPQLNAASELEKKGRFEEVAELYRRAIKLRPELRDSHYNLANCLYKHLGRPDEAIAEHREAQRIDPAYLEAYIMLGNIFADQRRDEDAEAEFRSAIAAAGPHTDHHTLAKAHYNLANSLARMGRNDEALVEYQEALRLNPQHYEAQYGIGYAHNRMDRIIEAVAAYRAALAINPDYAPARKALESHVGQEALTQPAAGR